MSNWGKEASSTEPIAVKLPSLPGIRRHPIESPPKIFSKTRPRQRSIKLDKSVVDNGELLKSYLEEFADSISQFPKNAESLSDTFGRYSVKAHNKDRETKHLSLPFSNLDNVPSFVVNPKGRACHFLAYFTELVPENLKEPSRIRIVEIVYYIESNTLEIIEQAKPNSGLCHGRLLNNLQVKNPEKNRFFLLEDFKSGAQLNIYNKIYTIVDCDNECKRYMSQLGHEFGEPLEIPNNDGTYESAKHFSKSSYFSKIIHPGDEEKVLKFTGLWNGNDVQLFYKIYDNTISLFCINEINPSDRRAQVQMLIKNTRVVKENLDGSEDDSTILITTAEEVGLPSTEKIRYFLHWHDLKLGATLPMQGLKVQLLDADKATRDFYQSYGLKLPPAVIVERPKVEAAKPVVPPHTGFGSYDDSITSCQGSLIPHTLKKNVVKMKQFQDVKIQYKALLISPVEPNENPRKFIIVMYLEDDNIQVLELPEKNSGRLPGAFLSKRKLQNPDGSLRLNPQDLYAGARLTINGFTFEIYHSANKATLKYMEQHTEIWSCCNINKISKKLLLNADEIKSVVFNSGRYEPDAVLTIDTFQSLLNGLSSASANPFLRQEVITLIRYLTDAGNSKSDSQDESITVTQLINLLDSFSDESVY